MDRATIVRERERERESGESEYDESSSCSIIFSCFREEIL